MKDAWIELKNLLGLQNMPKTVQGLTFKAKSENWRRRRVEGVKGKIFEYYIGDMPLDVQQALGFTASASEPTPEAPQQLSQGDLQQRIRQLEDKLNALVGAQQVTTPPDGISRKEWQLVQAYRRCNEDRKIMALSAVEALAAQTEQEQKESEEPLKDHQVA